MQFNIVVLVTCGSESQQMDRVTIHLNPSRVMVKAMIKYKRATGNGVIWPRLMVKG